MCHLPRAGQALLIVALFLGILFMGSAGAVLADVSSTVSYTELRSFLDDDSLFKPYDSRLQHPDIMPAEIENVQLTFKSNVVQADLSTFQRNQDSGMFTVPDLALPLEGRLQELTPGMIFVDPQTLEAVRADIINATGTGFWDTGKVQLHEIVDELDIPWQESRLNVANVTRVNKYASSLKPVLQAGPSETPSALHSGDFSTGIKIVFPEGTTFSYQGFEVKIEGDIEIWNMDLVVKYSGFSGYDFAIKLGEQINLSVDVAGELNEVLQIPLFGLEVGVPSIASVAAGFFLHVSVTGKLRLVVEADQELSAQAGVHGKTRFWVPKSFKPYAQFSERFNVDADLDMNLNGRVEVGPLLAVRVIGIGDVFAVDVRGGIEMDVVRIDKGEERFLDIALFARGMGHASIVGKRYNLFDTKNSIRQEKKVDTGHYTFEIHDACSYLGVVRGRIYDKTNNTPYQGAIAIKRLVRSYQNGEWVWVVDLGFSTAQTMVDEEGFFERYGLELWKKHRVQIEIPSLDVRSQLVETTIPFAGIDFLYADFFQDQLALAIPSGKDSRGEIIDYVGPVDIKRVTDGHLLGTLPFTAQNGEHFLVNHDLQPDHGLYAYLNIRGHELYSPYTPVDTELKAFTDITHDGLVRSIQTSPHPTISEWFIPLRIEHGEHLDISIVNLRGAKKVDQLGGVKIDFGSSCGIQDFPLYCGSFGDTIGINPVPAFMGLIMDENGNLSWGDLFAGESSARMTWRYEWTPENNPQGDLVSQNDPLSGDQLPPFLSTEPDISYHDPGIALPDQQHIAPLLPRLLFCGPLQLSISFEHKGKDVVIPVDSRGQSCQFKPVVDQYAQQPLERLLDNMRDERWNPVVNQHHALRERLDKVIIPATILEDSSIVLPGAMFGDRWIDLEIELHPVSVAADPAGSYWVMDPTAGDLIRSLSAPSVSGGTNRMILVVSALSTRITHLYPSTIRGDTLQIVLPDIASRGALQGRRMTLDYAGNLDDGETLYWKLGAVQERSSLEQLTFETEHPPGVFAKTSPAGGSTWQTTWQTLAWNASQGAFNYLYCVDTIDNDACDDSWISVGNSLSIVVSPLAADTTYYWQVRAVNPVDGTASDAGEWWSFTTQSIDELQEYGVRYHGNGNTGGSAPADPASPYQEGDQVTVLGPGDLTNEGFVFTGWNTAGDGRDRTYSPGGSFEIIEEVHLYAQWSAQNHTVTASLSAGGSIRPEGQVVVDHGGQFVFTITPDEGHALAMVSGTCGGMLDNDTYTTNPVYGDCTVEVSFILLNYLVRFTDYDGTPLKTEQVDHGQAATAPDAPTRVGYSFIGWDTNFSAVTGNLTVTAEYQKLSAETIPTLSQWSRLILTMLMLALGGFYLARIHSDKYQDQAV